MTTTQAAAIRIKRAYVEADPADGIRVLVDRLWPRGLSKERAHLDEWFKDIAPSPGLRRWFDHDPALLQEFSRRYRAELHNNPAAVAHMQELAAQGPLTLVYAARDPRCNHAQVLADYLINL